MTPDQVVPVAIRRVAAGGSECIEMEWSDGTTGRVTPRLLRDACPCATCREKQIGRAHV